MFGEIGEKVGLAIASVLLFLSWNGWVRQVRGNLPPWRNGISLAALLILSVAWATAALLEVMVLLHGIAAVRDLRWVAFHLWVPLNLLALILVVWLKGKPRALAAIACVAMLLSWPHIYFQGGWSR